MRIVVSRSGAVIKEIEVGDKDLRVGRSADNDIVLEDDDKSISRAHAEVRHQGSDLVVLDLNSQNGVWVQGQRVPMARLEPGVPITIGPYTLSLHSTVAPPPIPETSSNETQRLTAVKNQTVAYVRPAAPRAAEAAPAAASKRPAGPRVDPLTRLARLPKPKLFAIFGVIAVIAIGATVMLKPAGSTPTATVEPTPIDDNAAAIVTHLSAAKDLLAAGQAQAAIAEHLDRILLIAPGHQEALDLKASAERLLDADAPSIAVDSGEAPAEPVAPAEPAPSTVAAEPAPASPAITTPAAPPQSGAARAPARRASAAKPAVEDPPFARRPGETQTAWRERGAELQRRYRAAMAIFNRGEYARAADALQGIADDQPKYLDVEARLGEAHQQIRASAMTAFRTGEDLEQQGELAKALAQYERALQIDPRLQDATAAMSALQVRLQGAADDFYRRARQFDALGHRAEALDHYERALATLAPGDARRAAVHERLTLLRTLLKKAGGD